MQILTGVLLVFCLGTVWYFVRSDVADYAAFKLLTETAQRQRRYRVWALKSFLLFSGVSVICLTLLGRLHALATMPTEFRAASLWVQLFLGRNHVSDGFLAGFGIALLVGLVVGGLVMKAYGRKSQVMVIGDIEPLMPRNWQETAHTALLSLNAGLSEELFFRLLLPLLLTLLFGSTAVAFILAALIFGGTHLYQGRVGVAATTILGLILTGVYLWTGSLWITILSHILLDLVGLVVRPAIARAFAA